MMRNKLKGVLVTLMLAVSCTTVACSSVNESKEEVGKEKTEVNNSEKKKRKSFSIKYKQIDRNIDQKCFRG